MAHERRHVAEVDREDEVSARHHKQLALVQAPRRVRRFLSSGLPVHPGLDSTRTRNARLPSIGPGDSGKSQISPPASRVVFLSQGFVSDHQTVSLYWLLDLGLEPIAVVHVGTDVARRVVVLLTQQPGILGCFFFISRLSVTATRCFRGVPGG
jgi:hypothetical protein